MGLVDHEHPHHPHSKVKGFKVVFSRSGELGFQMSQYSSFYNRATSAQKDLYDGQWHFFVCRVTTDELQVWVDGIPGPVTKPSDSRGKQAKPEYGRFEHSHKYVLGNDNCCGGRTFRGSLYNVWLSWGDGQKKIS